MSDDIDDIDDIFENLDNEGDGPGSSGTEGGEVDRMAEMAAAMEADGVVVEDHDIDDIFASAAASDGEDSTDSTQSNPTNSDETESLAHQLSGQDVNVETLLKVPISLSIEVGRTQMVISDLLETQEGSVIELERLLDDPLDILVNGALIAHGVVVLADERFGIQITDIISLQERARSL